jgi:hypothetical protein
MIETGLIQNVSVRGIIPQNLQRPQVNWLNEVVRMKQCISVLRSRERRAYEPERKWDRVVGEVSHAWKTIVVDDLLQFQFSDYEGTFFMMVALRN